MTFDLAPIMTSEQQTWRTYLNMYQRDFLEFAKIGNRKQLPLLAKILNQEQYLQILGQPENTQTRMEILLEVLAETPVNRQLLLDLMEVFRSPLDPRTFDLFKTIFNRMYPNDQAITSSAAQVANPASLQPELDTLDSPSSEGAKGSSVPIYNVNINIVNLINTSTIQYTVHDFGEAKVSKLLTESELQTVPWGTRGIFSCLSSPDRQPKKGYAIYFSCTFDNHHETKRLRHAWKDDDRVKEALERITGNPIYPPVYNVKDKGELDRHLKAFRDSTPLDAEYTILIFSSHGTNDTQLYLDDCTPIDLYHNLVFELDHAQYNQLALDKPRIYLSNVCRHLSLEGVKAALNNPPKGRGRITSPYYVINAGSHGESVRDSSQGSNLVQAFCDVAKGGMSLTELALRVENRVQFYASQINHKQNISVDHNFMHNFNPGDFQL